MTLQLPNVSPIIDLVNLTALTSPKPIFGKWGDAQVVIGRGDSGPDAVFRMLIGSISFAAFALTDGYQMRDRLFKPLNLIYEVSIADPGQTRFCAVGTPSVKGDGDNNPTYLMTGRKTIDEDPNWTDLSPDGTGLPPEGRHLLQLFSDGSCRARFILSSVLPVIVPVVVWDFTGFHPAFTFLHPADYVLQVQNGPDSEADVDVLAVWAVHK